MIYWVAKVRSDPPPYVTAFYASSTPPPRENEKCELEIRPAGEQPKK